VSSLRTVTGPAPSGVTGHEFDHLREYVETRSGMEFAGVRERVLVDAVARRVSATRQPTVAAYVRSLGTPTGEAEWGRLLDQLLNGDTRFFRDPPALATLTGLALPRLRERRREEGTDRLALWSAGCSTGQEAYSLAMTGLAEPEMVGWRLAVLGTDVSGPALAAAEAGVYRAHAIADVPESFRRRFLVPHDAGYQIGPGVREVVRFQPHDLLTGSTPPPQDVIFCQNVLIYYRPDHRTEIVRRLTATLAPGGFLFLGAAEAVGLPTPGLELFRLEDGWVYQKTD
jgi:chemotaxis methyl-accepting protein methylase